MAAYERFVDAPRALAPKEWRELKLAKKVQVSPDSYKLTFAFPDENAVSGLETASCVVVRAAVGGGKPIVRPYTPVSLHTSHGGLELLVKRYDGGKVSKHLCDMAVGDSVEFKGPINKLKYKAGDAQRITMVAGGTGITPMWQMLLHMALNPLDKTKVNLVFCNVTKDDILMRKELEDLKARRPHMILDIHYVLDKPPPGWTGGKGYLTKEELAGKLPAPEEGNMVLVCGPDAMVAAVAGPKAKDKSQGDVGGILGELGWAQGKGRVYKF